MLEVGSQAPQFTLTDAGGNTVSLSDFIGKKLHMKKLNMRQNLQSSLVKTLNHT